MLAHIVGELERATDGVVERGLAVEHVTPARRQRVLEVAHEDFGARVERVDHHLRLGRAGDLDAAVLEVGGSGGDVPLALADRLRLGQEVEALAGVEALLARGARSQQLGAAWAELALQLGHEREGVVRQKVRTLRRDGADDLELGGNRHDGSPLINRPKPMFRRQEPNGCTWRL